MAGTVNRVLRIEIDQNALQRLEDKGEILLEFGEEDQIIQIVYKDSDLEPEDSGSTSHTSFQ